MGAQHNEAAVRKTILPNAGAGRGVYGGPTAEELQGQHDEAGQSQQPDRNQKLLTIKRSGKVNPLNAFRSYNYIFTLAALSGDSLDDPERYKDSSRHFVIAKSGGKGTIGISENVTGVTKTTETVSRRSFSDSANRFSEDTEISKTTDYSGANLVKEFNKESPGRFDFYINNVQIDTIMGFDKKTTLTVATKLEFELFEPYSMSGFIEALQTSAVASGHDQYANTPYLLKMEFLGYSDDDELSDNAIPVDFSTRYFVFVFTELGVSVDQNGTKYSCKGVPINEKAFGDASRLKTSIKASGTTVGKILNDFISEVDNSKEKEAASRLGQANSNKHDIYKISFPKVEGFGNIDDSNSTNFISSCKIGSRTSNSLYEFLENESSAETTRLSRAGRSESQKTFKTTELVPTVQFPENTNIYECIISIIRDSEYVTNIVEKFSTNPDSMVDSNGMVDYFSVSIETTENGIFDETTNKPFYTYNYVVMPYKMHYTRIPLSTSGRTVVDTNKITLIANRSYDYMYTGKNVDIKTFNLQFNTLFYQAIPNMLGNKPGYNSAATSIEPNGATDQNSVKKPIAITRNSSLGVSSIRIDNDQLSVHADGELNSVAPQSTPYAALAKNLHRAILTSVDQVQADIEIMGDPFYLVTGGIGNIKHKVDMYGQTVDGEATYNLGDVMVLLTFKNPVDIDEVTGEAIFNNKVGPYSGLFRVIKATSTFKDGIFMQQLSLIRIPAQPEDMNTEATDDISPATITVDNPSQSSTPAAIIEPTTLRASPDSLLASIATKLPSTGLPGQLSKFAGAAGGALSGLSRIAGSASQFAGGNGSALQGLTNVSSAIRLSAAGLSAFSSNINCAGASVSKLTDMTSSMGIPGASKLGNLTLSSIPSAASCIGSSALSAINNLGNDVSGAVSGVNSKISSLLGSKNALSEELGTNISKLSGLGSDFYGNISKQITDAVGSLPVNVDLEAAVRDGLLIDDIPTSSFKNIPATQPAVVAPSAKNNLADIELILSRGGQLKNIAGASDVPGISTLISESLSVSPLKNSPLDDASFSGKFSTVQSGIRQITGQNLSREALITNVKTAISADLPNSAGVSASVVEKFGSKSGSSLSPLDTLLANSVNSLNKTLRT